MSTGDLNCNVKRLRGVLRELRYTYASSLPEDRLREGDPSVLLPALHYCLLGYSSKVAAEVSRRGYELQAKTDERFVEHCWRFLREHFNLMPQLNKHQFLSKGFAERKLMLVTEVAKKCKELHSSLSRKAKLQTKRTPKGAHLESVFPPVAKRAAAHDGSNSGEVREVVVSHVDRDPESPIPVPKTPPRIIISGAGEAPADQERVQKEDSDIAEASSEALSSEYTSEDYEDEEDDGIITEEEDAGVQHPDEEEEEEAFHGFRQSPVDYVNHSPAGTLEQGKGTSVPTSYPPLSCRRKGKAEASLKLTFNDFVFLFGAQARRGKGQASGVDRRGRSARCS